MQSDGISFGGDVVLDSFNMVYRDVENILRPIYKKQIFSDHEDYEDFRF